MKLTVGAVDQTVDVTASAPLLETQGSNLGKVVATKAISDLPLFISGGSVRGNLAFVILTPGGIGPAGNPRSVGGLLGRQRRQVGGHRTNRQGPDAASASGGR